VFVPGEPPITPLDPSIMCLISFVDPETGREKGEVSLWRDECGTSGDPTTQAEEEGQQDGLDDDGLCTLSALHCTIVFNTWLFLVFILPCVFSLTHLYIVGFLLYIQSFIITLMASTYGGSGIVIGTTPSSLSAAISLSWEAGKKPSL
jgi:hypothetical protein